MVETSDREMRAFDRYGIGGMETQHTPTRDSPAQQQVRSMVGGYKGHQGGRALLPCRRGDPSRATEPHRLRSSQRTPQSSQSDTRTHEQGEDEPEDLEDQPRSARRLGTLGGIPYRRPCRGVDEPPDHPDS